VVTSGLFYAQWLAAAAAAAASDDDDDDDDDDDAIREETSLTRKTSPHRYDSDEEAFN